MYQTMKSICSVDKKASGPALDVEHVLENRKLYQDCIDHITSVPRKQFSHYASKMLDHLGYSNNMTKERQKMRNEDDRIHNRMNGNVLFRVTTGGKGEGTSLTLESDSDFMFVNKNYLCTNRPQDFNHARNVTIFQTDMQDTSPGYTCLKLVRLNEDCDRCVRDSLLMTATGSCYISSTRYKSNNMTALRNCLRNCQDDVVTFGDISGPSTPASGGLLSIDTVFCFPCICDDILERWVARPRYHGWPSLATILEISSLEGHVVPVGFKGSENMCMEWRICYSLAELHLMRTFNEFQLKVYVVLKKISKSVLNPVCKDMTSYIMKNVVFWVSEAKGVERFTEDLLLDRILDCIRYLRKCVREKTLLSYMIPERNLFARILDDQHRRQLTDLLSCLLNEGWEMLLRCDRFREASVIMYLSPDMLKEFAEKRDKVESMLMIKRTIMVEILRPGISADEERRLLSQNERIRDVENHFVYLMQFDAQTLIQMGLTAEQVNYLFQMRLKELLS